MAGIPRNSLNRKINGGVLNYRRRDYRPGYARPALQSYAYGGDSS
ncbi:hypothetical protein [Bifidobacterium callimiconis]|nr:hypothetical protein [Bifidobacterium callimiconis]